MGSSRRSAPPPPPEESPAAQETPSSVKNFPDGPARTIDPAQPHKAVITTNKGDIVIDLFPDAPQAVNSFAFLAGAGFYDNNFFFYVDHKFVAQAGDPACSGQQTSSVCGTGGPGYTLPVEKTSESHDQWTVVAPAVLEGQSVHGSQFRILFNADQRLDGKETVFGRVVQGQDILEALPDFVPCSVVQAAGCQPKPDMSAALVIQRVIVQPA
ncbi:MAG TPA: peptidylprolyl isomerase [Dehalococcoidia bacterium]|nr:peptidylprolyl isomerase [Dehalococcoidia bacterium]